MTNRITVMLANIPIGIETLYLDAERFFADYRTEESPAFSVSVSDADIALEREKSRAEAELEGHPVVNYSPKELEKTAIYRKIAQKLPSYGALVFHGSAVAVDGKAYLFTAKSGTGKTTHTRLWLKNIPGSFIVNGDKPILRLTDGKAFVCGTPWMGKENYGCNLCVPLAAICVLTRGAENAVEETPLADAFPTLVTQSYRPPTADAFLQTLTLIENLGNAVKLYTLACNMEDEAALVSYNAMHGE